MAAAHDDPSGEVPVGAGLARIDEDRHRPGAYTLVVDGTPQSHVDLDDPTHLAFEYVRRIGHAIGVSRVVCAMHYPADVAPGEALGRAVAAEAAATPAFQADVVAARAELARVRAAGLTNPGCVAEATTLALPLPSPAG